MCPKIGVDRGWPEPLIRYVVRLAPERAAETREALEDLTEGQVVETAATSDVVTFEITVAGPGRREAEGDMIEVAPVPGDARTLGFDQELIERFVA